MILKKHLLNYALLLSAFFLSNTFSAQEVLKLLPGSKKAHYFEENDLLKLAGDVNFEYQENTMFCDSAYYFEDAQIVRAYGNVHIIKETLNIFCDSAYFNGIEDKSKLWGRVKMRDGDYKLTTDSIDYDSKSGRATYRCSWELAVHQPMRRSFRFCKTAIMSSRIKADSLPKTGAGWSQPSLVISLIAMLNMISLPSLKLS